MFKFAKKAHWLQTQVVKGIACTAPAIGHNIDKIRAIKKAFHFVNMESVPGDYLEFGMYEGTSFIGAFECHMQTRQSYTPPRKFWGFDSFEGFKYSSNADAHPFFQEGEFKSSYESTCRRIARHLARIIHGAP